MDHTVGLHTGTCIYSENHLDNDENHNQFMYDKHGVQSHFWREQAWHDPDTVLLLLGMDTWNFLHMQV